MGYEMIPSYGQFNVEQWEGWKLIAGCNLHR